MTWVRYPGADHAAPDALPRIDLVWVRSGDHPLVLQGTPAKNPLTPPAPVGADPNDLVPIRIEGAMPEPVIDGCWVAYYYDKGAMAVFADETSALRFALDNSMSAVKFMQWGESL